MDILKACRKPFRLIAKGWKRAQKGGKGDGNLVLPKATEQTDGLVKLLSSRKDVVHLQILGVQGENCGGGNLQA